MTENPGHFDTPTPDILTKTPDILTPPYKDTRGRLNHQEPIREPSGEEREENAPAPASIFPAPASNSRCSFSNSRCSAAASALVPPPSIQDVRDQLREIGQSESHAEKFHAYYDERGWTKGRDNRPVEDWRKTLTTWLLREPEFQSRGSSGPAQSGKPAREATPPGRSALGARAEAKIERLAAVKAAASGGNRLDAPAGQENCQDIYLTPDAEFSGCERR